MLKIIVWASLPLFCLHSCTTKKDKRSDNETPSAFALEMKYAKGFGIDKLSDHYLLKFYSPFRDTDDTLVYVVGKPVADPYPPEYRRIKKPVNSAVLLASSHAAFLEKLGKMSIITGISTKDYFYNEDVLTRVEQGAIVELGFGQNINTEKLMVLDPQLLVFSGMSSSDVVRYALAQQAGIVLFPSAEWQEHHPLGRAEWIKVFGLITGAYEASDSIFKNIEEQYLRLKNKEIEGDRPSVIVNAPYKDVWWLPGGNSFVSQLIEDAEADYVWRDNSEEGGMQIDIESIFHQAHDADFWINPGQFKSIKDLVAQDGRYLEFSALKNKNVYNNDLRINKNGGNDYYETGLVRPDLILADLIKIFHSEALPGHEFYFYRKLP